jgi:hypothetical protein
LTIYIARSLRSLSLYRAPLGNLGAWDQLLGLGFIRVEIAIEIEFLFD